MRSANTLFQVSEPWILKSNVSPEMLLESVRLHLPKTRDFKVIVLAGDQMQTAATFYDELIRGFSLPNYFGRNLNALAECLTDLEWLKGTGYLVFIDNGDKVLCSETPEKLEGFFDVLKRVGAEWSRPVAVGEAWDRPARAFHTIFKHRNPNWRIDLPLLTELDTRKP